MATSKNTKNKVVGSVKKAVGKAVGNTQLEDEGKRQRAKGLLNDAVQNVKDSLKSIVD
jgi:uncharacterized protein YjbJ (UPF0337 family)